ncbi:hypothetical protein HMPREF1141_1482 [Clostridium sp. MSTE9]|nr:hypothetical protein HMPREF1141_1482 [Clostridium sp. MSTE9]
MNRLFLFVMGGESEYKLRGNKHETKNRRIDKLPWNAEIIKRRRIRSIRIYRYGH